MKHNKDNNGEQKEGHKESSQGPQQHTKQNESNQNQQQRSKQDHSDQEKQQHSEQDDRDQNKQQHAKQNSKQDNSDQGKQQNSKQDNSDQGKQQNSKGNSIYDFTKPEKDRIHSLQDLIEKLKSLVISLIITHLTMKRCLIGFLTIVLLLMVRNCKSI